MTNKTFNRAYVRSWLFDTFDFTEDGAPIIGERFDISVGNDYGQNFIHSDCNFTNLKKFVPANEEEAECLAHLYWVHDRTGLERAERFAKKVQAHLDAGGELNMKYWHEVDPSYGSKAYQDFGTELINRERERQEDMDDLFQGR
jgi:hypothetical protein